MKKLSTFQESFEFFNFIRDSDNEYYSIGERIGIVEEKVPTGIFHTFQLEGLIKKIEKKYSNDDRSRIIVDPDAVKRFHPNNINNKEFWIECRKSFPLLSVCGAESKTIEDVNKQTLGFSQSIGLLTFLKDKLIHSKNILNVLEIGCGYGNLFYEIKDVCNYYGIDYIIHDTLQNYHNFIEIDHSGIPEIFLNEKFFDIVYCVNVLQHCSQRDRFAYFKQAHEALKPGGYFLFTEFLMTDENKNESCWGILTEDGRGYTQSFNQLTECDTWEELRYILLEDIGFKIIEAKIGHRNNCLSMIVQK